MRKIFAIGITPKLPTDRSTIYGSLHMIVSWLLNSEESLKINMIELLPLGMVMEKIVKFLCDKCFQLGEHYPCEHYHPAKDDLEVNDFFSY